MNPAPPPSPPPPLPAGAKPRAKEKKNFSPKKDFLLFFRFAESILKLRHTARILGGQNPKKKYVLSILEKIHPRENKKSKEHFFFLGLPSEARRWRGFRGAYDLVSSCHALRAC